MRRVRRYSVIWMALCLMLFVGCGAGKAPAPSSGGHGTASSGTSAASKVTSKPEGGEKAPESGASSQSESAPKRDSTPQVLVPEAPGSTVLGAEPLIVDASHTDQGYVMARYTGETAKASILITGPDGTTYKYFLPPSEAYAALPLTSGNGEYTVDGYENIEGNQYLPLFKESVSVTLEKDLLPFLYPNLYVNFTAESEAVKKAQEVAGPAADDLEALGLIYHYVVENVTYDQPKADAATSGYLPVVDETLRTGKGICFDYAALTAAMLRSQRIPTKLEIGYAGKIYHSWISVYIEEVGWIDRVIEFTGDGWTRMDPTFASSSGGSDAVLKYIGDGTNYQLQYSR